MHIYTRTLTAWLSRRPHQRYMLTANIKFALRPFAPGFDPLRGSNIWPYKRRYFVSRTESIGRNQSIERQNVNNDDPRRYNAIRRRPSKLTFSRHIRVIIVSLSDNQLLMRNPFGNLFTRLQLWREQGTSAVLGPSPGRPQNSGRPPSQLAPWLRWWYVFIKKNIDRLVVL
jgi:hypothetical protein